MLLLDVVTFIILVRVNSAEICEVNLSVEDSEFSGRNVPMQKA